MSAAPQHNDGFRWSAAPRFHSSKGREIIKKILLEHGIHPDDFFGRHRDDHLIKARVDAARRLSGAGYTYCEIARMLKRNHTTIMNYFPGPRAARTGRYRRKVILEILSSDVRDVVIACAKAEGIAEKVLIAQWIAERATHEATAKARDAA